MTSATDYRRFASECRRFAARSAIPAHAAILREIAETWERRARDAKDAAAARAATAPAGPADLARAVRRRRGG
jgi:hypothetical protein